MPITLVGTPQVGAAGNGADVTLTFDESPAEGDLVVLIGGAGWNGTNNFDEPGPADAGYTDITTSPDHINDGSFDYKFGAWYKFMGATPDTTVTGDGTGNARHGVVYTALVLRGVDPDTPLDTAIVITGSPQTGTAQAPAITTVTDSAWVIVCVGGDSVDADAGTVTDYGNHTGSAADDSDDFACHIATREIAAAGTETPGTWSGFSFNTDWMAFSLAIRPAAAGGGGGETAAFADGAVAGDGFGAVASAGAAWTDGAVAGDTPTALAQATAAIAEGVVAGDTWVAQAAALATFVEGAVAGEQWDALAAAAAAFTEGAVAGDSWTTSGVETAALVEGALAGESFAAAVAALAAMVEGANVGDSYTAAVAAAASWRAGVVVGDTWRATIATSAAWADGMLAGDAFAEAEVQVGRILSATLTLLTVHHATRTIRTVEQQTRTIKAVDSATS